MLLSKLQASVVQVIEIFVLTTINLFFLELKVNDKMIKI